MPPTTVIPPILAVGLPLIGPPIATWLGRDRLGKNANAVIATIIVVIAAIFWAIYARTLSSNPIDNIVLIAGYVAILAANPLHALYIVAGPTMQRLWQYRPWSAYVPEEFDARSTPGQRSNEHKALPTGVSQPIPRDALAELPTRPMPAQDDEPPTT